MSKISDTTSIYSHGTIKLVNSTSKLCIYPWKIQYAYLRSPKALPSYELKAQKKQFKTNKDNLNWQLIGHFNKKKLVQEFYGGKTHYFRNLFSHKRPYRHNWYNLNGHYRLSLPLIKLHKDNSFLLRLLWVWIVRFKKIPYFVRCLSVFCRLYDWKCIYILHIS